MEEPVIKDWVCSDCGAIITDPQGTFKKLIDEYGNQVGCAFCGSIQRKPDWDWINKKRLPNDETAQSKEGKQK